MPRWRSFWLSLLLALAVATPVLATERIAVIVHPSRTIEGLTPLNVKRIFLKQQRYWGGRDPVIPVNREPGADARTRFALAVLGSDSRRLEQYWNRQYFQGVLPPATMVSGEAIRRFVATEPGAIGYVPESLVDSSVKVVLYLD